MIIIITKTLKMLLMMTMVIVVVVGMVKVVVTVLLGILIVEGTSAMEILLMVLKIREKFIRRNMADAMKIFHTCKNFTIAVVAWLFILS